MKKLETHIKETLENRKITPAPKAWDAVATKIALEKKPKQKRFYVYAIAASFIGVLLVSAVFLVLKQPKATIQVVEDSSWADEKIPQKEDNMQFHMESQEKQGITGLDVTRSAQKETKTVGLDALPTQVKIAEEPVKQSLRDNFLEESNDLIAQKVSEIVTQVALLETQNSEVTDAEIDALLMAAQRQILSEQIVSPDGAIDAVALLTEVEDELNTSFRNQIFDALKDGYFELRTAVANRNN
ncbi:MAG: hypothetical protein ABJN84_11765 [Flavobacteriaceae bacterium]